MPLFQPSNVTPSSFAGIGEGTVDVNDNVNISWQVNGNEAMTKCIITVSTTNNVTVATIQPTITTPVYPTDQNGNPNFFTYAPTNTTWASLGLQNGNTYYLTIQQFWGSLPVEENSITQISPSVFITRNTPTVSLSSSNSSPDSAFLYQVTDNITLSNSSWFNSGDPAFPYLSLATLFQTLSTGDLIAVKFPSSGATSPASAYAYIRINGVWTETSAVYYSTMPSSEINQVTEISMFAIIAVSSSPINHFTANYTQAQGDAVNWSRWDLSTFNEETKSVGTMIYDTGIVYTSNLIFYPPPIAENGLYLIRCTVESQNGQQAGNGAVALFYYPQRALDVTVQTQRTIENGSILFTIDNETINTDTVYLYKQDGAVLDFIYSLDTTSYNQIRLFSVKSNEAAEIMVFGQDLGGSFSVGDSVSLPACLNRSCYLYITEKDETEDNVYHVVASWRFGNNLSFGSVSNNNAPNFLTNFTGYRLKQPTARKGKSGTLQALLSNVSQGDYQDTALMMDNLYAISECKNPMFLKDTKGNMYMVTVSAPITQTVNTRTAIQEVSVSLPWEEIGCAVGVSLIQIPTDQGWIGDNTSLAMVRFTVDPETGMLQVEYPTNYSGTTFALNRNALISSTPNEIRVPTIGIEEEAVILNTED